MAVGNFTSLNLISDLLTKNVFGSTALLGIFIVFFFAILLLIARSFGEVVLLIPAPLLVALAKSGILPNWVEGIVWIIAAFYLVTIIIIIAGLRR